MQAEQILGMACPLGAQGVAKALAPYCSYGKEGGMGWDGMGRGYNILCYTGLGCVVCLVFVGICLFELISY
jgi:hypothetical protein